MLGSCARADQIDLKSLDEQLERHLGRPAERGGVAAAAAVQVLGAGTGSRGAEDQQTPLQRCREDWEIDPAKLIIKGVIARGTFGTVHRGVYDCQDVAGIVHTILPLYNYLRAHNDPFLSAHEHELFSTESPCYLQLLRQPGARTFLSSTGSFAKARTKVRCMLHFSSQLTMVGGIDRNVICREWLFWMISIRELSCPRWFSVSANC
jgi:hypothetical protein